MWSYRDPQNVATLDVMVDVLRQACDHPWSSRDLEEGLLDLFSSIDAPETPTRKPISAWLTGITLEQRQQYRDQLFALNRSDLQSAAQFLVSALPQASAVIAGPAQIPSAVLASGIHVINLEIL